MKQKHIIVGMCAVAMGLAFGAPQAHAKYDWKAYFRVNQVKAVKEAVTKTTINALEGNDEDWRGVIRGRNIKDGTIDKEKLSDNGCKTGQVLKYDGKAWVCADLGVIADGSIGSAKIANGAIGTDKIENGAVTTEKIKDGTITGGDLASNIAIATSGKGSFKGGVEIGGGYADGVGDGGISIGTYGNGNMLTRGSLTVDGEGTFFGGITAHGGKVDLSQSMVTLPDNSISNSNVDDTVAKRVVYTGTLDSDPTKVPNAVDDGNGYYYVGIPISEFDLANPGSVSVYVLNANDNPYSFIAREVWQSGQEVMYTNGTVWFNFYGANGAYAVTDYKIVVNY